MYILAFSWAKNISTFAPSIAILHSILVFCVQLSVVFPLFRSTFVAGLDVWPTLACFDNFLQVNYFHWINVTPVYQVRHHLYILLRRYEIEQSFHGPNMKSMDRSIGLYIFSRGKCFLCPSQSFFCTRVLLFFEIEQNYG